jgi:hypothetical protein
VVLTLADGTVLGEVVVCGVEYRRNGESRVKLGFEMLPVVNIARKELLTRPRVLRRKIS